MNEILDISSFLEKTNADAIIILNFKGELIESKNIHKPNNIAAMIGVMLTMVSSFAEDTKIGTLTQCVCKAEDGLFIINKLDDESIVGVISKDITKVGLIMMSMNKLRKI